MNSGINYQPQLVIARFLPSTVSFSNESLKVIHEAILISCSVLAQDTGGGPGGGPGGGGTLTGQQKCHNQVTPTKRSGNMGRKLRG